jgi:2-oxopent-4-enoate/cis-2-oxohex-4-enoate hydratase
MLNMPEVASAHTQIAERLWLARTQGAPIPPISAEHPEWNLADAYRVSRDVFERRLTLPGIKSVGRKIGLTSLAVQTQLKVSQPDFGYLTSDMVIDAGGVIPARGLIQGRAEGEVAFILGSDLRGPGVTFADVVRATDHVVACIEIIDSRVRDWKIGIVDTIADNASSAYLVLGTRPRRVTDLDLRMAGMTLRLNGAVESTGVGAACLNHPVNAVAWLANTLSEFGEGLRMGDIVLSGAYGPVVPFRPGDHCEVEISGLGKVSCAIAPENSK